MLLFVIILCIDKLFLSNLQFMFQVLWIELLRIHASTFVKLPVDQMSFILFQAVCHRAIQATESYNVFQEVTE